MYRLGKTRILIGSEDHTSEELAGVNRRAGDGKRSERRGNKQPEARRKA